MQVDESTDTAGLSVLLAFVRCIYNSPVEEEMLMCKPLPSQSIGGDIFNVTDLYMDKKALVGNNVLIFAQTAEYPWLGKHMVYYTH
jgi:hypothetical protein